MEQQQQSEAELAREKVEELESALDDEKRKRDACEQQIQQHLQVWTTKLSFENGKYFYNKINFFHLLALNSLTLKYDKIMIHEGTSFSYSPRLDCRAWAELFKAGLR